MRKIGVAVLVFGMAVSMTLSGCGNKDAEKKASAETKKEEVKVEQEYPVIGKESKDGYSILIENKLDSGIKKVSIKHAEAEAYPEGIGLDKDAEWKKDETVKLCYTPEQVEEKEGNGSDKKLNELYDIQFTLADDSTVEVNGIGLDDFKEDESVKLCFEDDVVFLQYTSASNGDQVSTKEYQLAVKAQKEAEEQAKREAEEKAKQEAEEKARQEAEAQQQAEAAPVYEEPVYEEPVYEEPVYEEPVYDEPAQSTDGCLGGVVIQ